MPLPSQSIVAKQIEDFITSNKEANPEKALADFSNFLAGLILDTIKSGDIKGVATIVTGSLTPAGTVSGTGSQSGVVKIT